MLTVPSLARVDPRGPGVEELSAEAPDVADPCFPLVAYARTEKAR